MEAEEARRLVRKLSTRLGRGQGMAVHQVGAVEVVGRNSDWGYVLEVEPTARAEDGCEVRGKEARAPQQGFRLE